MRRGARLDESAPGSGLGLSIIDELAPRFDGLSDAELATLTGLLTRTTEATR